MLSAAWSLLSAANLLLGMLSTVVCMLSAVLVIILSVKRGWAFVSYRIKRMLSAVVFFEHMLRTVFDMLPAASVYAGSGATRQVCYER